MRRSYVDEFWQRLFSRSRNDDSFIVERLWNYPGISQSKNSGGLLITRIFNPCRLARIEQCCCGNQHRLLHTADDHDLVRMTASRSEIRSDEFWQRLFSRSRNDDSFIVERLWNYPGISQSKNSGGLLITRIFNPCRLARIEQCCCGNQHRLLHTADDHDLVRMTASRSEI